MQFKILGQVADSLGRFAAIAQIGRYRDVLTDRKHKMRPTNRHAIPFISLEQGQGLTPHHYRGKVYAAPHRNVCRAALESKGLPRNGAGAFREDDQVSPAAYRGETLLQHSRPAVVADVSRCPNRPVGEWIPPQSGFDDAIGVAYQGHQEHDVDQGRVIGHDQQASALQSFEPVGFVAQYPEQPHHADKCPKRHANYCTRPSHPALRVALAQLNARKYDEAQHQTAHPEGGKAGTGCQHAPGASHLFNHGAASSLCAGRHTSNPARH